MRISLFMLLLVSSLSYASSVFGDWGTTCDDDGFTISLNNEPSPLVINDNQIVISVHSKVIDSKTIDLFFDNTLDLGSGGMAINWSNIDKANKIAELTLSGSNQGLLKWFGFRDNKLQKNFWVKEPDFIQSYAKGGVIEMQKCAGR